MGVDEKEGVVFLEEEGGEKAGEDVLTFLVGGGLGEATSSFDSLPPGFAVLSDNVRVRGAFVAVEGCLVKSVFCFFFASKIFCTWAGAFLCPVQTTSFGVACLGVADTDS